MNVMLVKLYVNSVHLVCCKSKWLWSQEH